MNLLQSELYLGASSFHQFELVVELSTYTILDNGDEPGGEIVLVAYGFQNLLRMIDRNVCVRGIFHRLVAGVGQSELRRTKIGTCGADIETLLSTVYKGLRVDGENRREVQRDAVGRAESTADHNAGDKDILRNREGRSGFFHVFFGRFDL